jgi:predicted dehydrogenase
MSLLPREFTRREFAKLSALSLGARFAPRLAAQPAERQTGYAIIGLGRIAAIFMAGVRNSANSKVTALVSGHRDKALRIAADYGVPESSIYNYENFDSIVSNKNVDAVYVALPNSMHAEYSIRAAKAGKHVLCEKPMANSVDECEQMIAASKSAGVKLMIAYRCQYEPTNLKAIDLIRSGAIGQVQAIESAFGFRIAPGEWRLDKKLAGGGPLVDVGIYSLNATRYLTGEEPVSFAAFASTIDKDGRFKEVEENLSWTMRFPSGIVAACNTSYGAATGGFYKVHGSKGWIDFNPAFNYDGLRLRAEYYSAPGASPTVLDLPSTARNPYQFQAEAEHFAHCVQNGLEPKTPGEEGLRDMRYIAEIYRAAGATA